MRIHAIVWISSLVLMLWTIGFSPVQRTQEARVVESAREMIEQPAEPGWRAWLIPRANGEVRLQKPPLAYWMSALSFKLFGVHDWAGRLPMAVCGWATIVLTYHIAARELASLRTAVWSAALLAGSFLFHRHARLAETDVVLTLLLTTAIYAIWRGSDLTDRRHLAWFALSGAAIGLCAIVKGLPAVFPIVFLMMMTLITQRWTVPLRWIVSGAPILALLIGLPWWIYAWRLPEAEVYAREMGVLIDEPNHPGWFFVYFAYLLKATAPWSPIFVIALFDVIASWRRDRRIVVLIRPLLAWCGAVLVPLFFIANKQEHYLLPMMPPLAMVAAWWLNERANAAWRRGIAVIAAVSLALSAVALPIASRRLRGDIFSTDLFIAMGMIILALILIRARRGALDVFCIACAMMMSAVIGYWWPSTQTRSHRNVAAEIRGLGTGPYYFYGENFSLPLVYNLRAIVPQLRDARELTAAMSRQPDLLIIAQTKANRQPPPVPIGCETIREIFLKDQKFEIYRSIQ